MFHAPANELIDAVKDFGRFSMEFQVFRTLSRDFESYHSFAEREKVVQWIAQEILHRMKYIRCAGKRMDTQSIEYTKIQYQI